MILKTYEKKQKHFSAGSIRKGGEIQVLLKARLSLDTFKEFVLTRDKERRKLFIFIIKLIRSKKLLSIKGWDFCCQC